MGFKMKGPDSMGFLNMNRNKRSVTLDLKTEEDKQAFYELAKTADVIVEHYRPGAVKRLGIDYESIKAVNSKIIYVSISRSEERRVGKECGSTCRYRWLAYH